MKVCSLCRVPKAPEDFHKHAGRPDGRQHRCKVCQCAGVRASYARKRSTRAAPARPTVAPTMRGNPRRTLAPSDDTPYVPDPWAISTAPPIEALFAELDSRRRR